MTLHDIWVWYYWITAVVSFCLVLPLPTKLSPWENFTGSFMTAVFGFVLWPLVVYAAYKSEKNADS